MSKIILTFFFLIPTLLFCQNKSIMVEGRVAELSKFPLEYVIIQNSGTGDGCISDALGKYQFKTSFPITLRISCVGYKAIIKHIFSEIKGDTVNMDFNLEVDSSILKEVTITAIHEPELVKESGTFMDFEISRNKLWLLNRYEGKDHIEAYDTNLKYLTSVIVKKYSNSISTTPHGFLYLSNTDSIRLLKYKTPENLISVSSINKEKFKTALENLSAFRNYTYYYSMNSVDSAVSRYWFFNGATKQRGMLYYYKSFALSLQNDSLVAEMRKRADNLKETQNNDYKLKLLLGRIYCPIRVVRDSIYIFNFDIDSIYVYSSNTAQVRQMPLSFFNFKYNSQDIVVDEENHECYYCFAYKGSVYLQKIDLDRGEKLNTQKLDFAFPEKIRIWNGYVYYTVSDTHENGMFIRHLYKQKL